MEFDEWFREFNSWKLTFDDFVRITVSGTSDDDDDIVHTSPDGCTMTRHMAGGWIDFYSAAKTGWNAAIAAHHPVDNPSSSPHRPPVS